MRTIMMTVAVLLALVNVAPAQEGQASTAATTETSTTAKPANTYIDALRTCGAEWKASDARKAVAKGEGVAAWNAYRAECVKRVGYTTKRGKAS